MSDQQHTSQSIKLKPIINYPREAQVGQTYLMSIDVQLLSADTPWPYPEEEYPISFILNMQPYFRYEALNGEDRAGVVLHRFGGTYGPAHYLLTASEQPVAPGHISITFINRWGLPITYMELECEVKSELAAYTPREVTFAHRERTARQEKEEDDARMEEMFEADMMREMMRDAEEEEKKRANFDRIQSQLEQTGWVVQGFSDIDLSRHRGIAVAHLPNLPDDYLLFIDQQLVGIINVYQVGEALAGVEEAVALKPLEGELESWLKIPAKHTKYRTLPFVYESTGIETRFTNYLEPEPRSRSVFTFHRPETLALWLEQGPADVPVERNDLLRSRLRRMPPVQQEGLYGHQAALPAITAIEKSLAANHTHTLIHMPTGTGKTTALVNLAYRLLEFANARRVLYIVNSSPLEVYERFEPLFSSGSKQRFIVWNMQDAVTSVSSGVSIATVDTVQEVMRKNASIEDQEIENTGPLNIRYNPEIPIEAVDMIIIDDCDSRIYREIRPALEYFDAFIIGATSEMGDDLPGMFGNNVVYEYKSDVKLNRALIFTMLPVAYNAVRSHLTNTYRVTHAPGKFIYDRGTFVAGESSWEVLLANIGIIGTAGATEIVQEINYCTPAVVLFVGVASGLKDVQTGDVVVANKIYRYEAETAKEALSPGETLFPGEEFIRSLNFQIEQVVRSVGTQSGWLTQLQGQVPVRVPRIWLAPILASETVTASSISYDLFNSIRSRHDDAVAIEMETADFLLAAASTYTPMGALVIRGIANLIEERRKAGTDDAQEIVTQPDAIAIEEEEREVIASNMQEIAAKHASAFAFEILAQLEYKQRDQIFISYSHNDKEWWDRLRTTLTPQIQADQIKIWDDTRILPGSNWKQEIDKALETARVAVLLVSASFFASDFILDHELPAILEAAKNGDIKLLPVVLSPCAFYRTPLASYQAINDPSKPLNSFAPRAQERELVRIWDEIKKAIDR